LTATVKHQFSVSFSAGHERVGPVAVGQANILRAIGLSADPAHLNLTTVWRLPSGTTTDQIGEVVRQLLVRHESLRTFNGAGPAPVQRVLASGRLDIPVYEAVGESSGYAEELARDMRGVGFALGDELPLRVAVVSEHGAPVHVAMVVSHVAMDATAWDLLIQEWDDLITGRDHPPGNEPQPIDLVALERRPSVKRLMAASLRHWESELHAIPQAMFTPTVDMAKADPTFRGLRVRARDAVRALDSIAERTGASKSSIILAAMSLLVGHYAGHERCVVTSISATRFLPELRRFFGTLAQDALMSINLREPESFDELVRHMRTSALRAFRHSWFDPMALWNVIDSVGDARGTVFARDCVFNDMSALVRGERRRDSQRAADTMDQRYPGVRVRAAARPADIVDETLGVELTWLREEWIGAPFILFAHNLDDELDLALWASPHVLSSSAAVNFGRAMIRLLVEAADRDVSLTSLRSVVDLDPISRGEGWHLVDSCWIQLEAVREVVAQVMGRQPHLVVALPDDQLGYRLVCYLETTTAGLGPEEIHKACMAALPGRPAAMAPHAYVVCERVLEDTASVDAWRRRPVCREGTGRPLRPGSAGQAP
jgi:hypothetical protein